MPAPRATNGTRSRWHARSTACTSSVDPGRHDELGDGAVPGEPVALVDAELLRLGDDVLGAERLPQLGDEGGGQAHAIESRAARRRQLRRPCVALSRAEVGFSRAADRASGEDRLRRPELLATTRRSRAPSSRRSRSSSRSGRSSLIGPGEAIVIPPIVTKADYEAELGVVIGARVKGVSKENAFEAVRGYLCANDVSARDLQFSDGQWTRGKSPDTFCPVGPMTPRDEISDPHALAIRAIVSGETLQDSTTANLIFGIDDVIAYVVADDDARAGRSHPHGDAGGRRRLPRSAAAAPAGGRGDDRDRGSRVADESRRRGMTEIGDLKAGVVGTGFIGVVHVEALRRLGVEVLGVVGSTPERAAAKGIASAYETLRRTARRRADRRRPPDDAQPAPLPAGAPRACRGQARRLREAARRHVPTSPRSSCAWRRTPGVVHCTNFNIRFYPIVQEARERVRAGELGAVWNVHGGYLQDWLRIRPTGTGGSSPSRRASCARSATSARTGSTRRSSSPDCSVVELLADLATAIPTRQRPVGEVETFAAAGEVEREDVVMTTEDIAHILLRFENGARGSVVLSQVAPAARTRCVSRWTARRERSRGTRSATRSSGSASATSRTSVVLRNAAMMHPVAAARTHLPVATPRLRRHVPRALRAPSTRTWREVARPTSPTSRPSATATSRTSSATLSRSRTANAAGWRCPHEARTAHRSVSPSLSEAGRRLGGERGLRDARGRLLARGRRRASPLRGDVAHRRLARRRRVPFATCSTGTGSRSRRSRTTRTTCTPILPSDGPRTRICGR